MKLLQRIWGWVRRRKSTPPPAVPSWLDMDDASLGRMLKLGAAVFCEGESNRVAMGHSAALILCTLASETNAETYTLRQHGVTRAGEPIGNFKIVVTRDDEKLDSEPSASVYDGDKLVSVSFRMEDGVVTAPELREAQP